MNWLDTLIDCTARSYAFAAVAGLVVCLGSTAAGFRRAVWTSVLVGMLAMPFLCRFSPAVPVPILRAGPAVIGVPVELPELPPVTLVAPSVQVSRRDWSWVPLALYLSIAALPLMRLAHGLIRRHQLIQTGTRIPADSWPEGSLTEEIEVIMSRDIHVPSATGWLRPRILLPVDWASWPAGKLQAIVAHEVAHIRQADPLILPLAAVNRSIFWFNPLAWWLEKKLASLSEQAADDAAVQVVRDPETYARTLFDVASICRRRPAWQGVSMARSSKVGGRIKRLLKENYRPTGPLTRGTLVATLVTSASVALLIAGISFQPRASAQQGSAPVLLAPSPFPPPDHDPELAARLELWLRDNPSDIGVRGRLLRHYSVTDRDAFLQNAIWLIEHAPGNETTSTIGFYLLRRPELFQASDARALSTLWNKVAERHADDASVLLNAGYGLIDMDWRGAESALKRARQLAPDDPRTAGGLINLYAGAIVAADRVENGAVISADRRAIAEHAKTELLSSGDNIIVGGVGRVLALQVRHNIPGVIWHDPSVGERLLNRARMLAPGSAEWLNEVAQLQRPPAPDARMPRSAPLKVVDMVPPVYPPLAKTARVQDVVRLGVTVSTNGTIAEMRLLSGHPLLVEAATHAVKQWKFEPRAGTTEVDVPFEIAAAGGTPQPEALQRMELLRHLLPDTMAWQERVRGKSLQISFVVDSVGIPQQVRTVHAPELHLLADEVTKRLAALRYQAGQKPHAFKLSLQWTNNGAGVAAVDFSSKEVR